MSNRYITTEELTATLPSEVKCAQFYGTKVQNPLPDADAAPMSCEQIRIPGEKINMERFSALGVAL